MAGRHKPCRPVQTSTAMTTNLIFQLTDEEDLEYGATAPSSFHEASDARLDTRADVDGNELSGGDIAHDADGLRTDDEFHDRILAVADELLWDDSTTHDSRSRIDARRTNSDLRLTSPRRGLGLLSLRAGAVTALVVLALVVFSVALSARHTGRSSAGQRSLVAAAASPTGQASLPASAPSPRRGRWPISPPRSPVAPSSRDDHHTAHRSPRRDRGRLQVASLHRADPPRPRRVVIATAAPQPDLEPQAVAQAPAPPSAPAPTPTAPTRSRPVAGPSSTPAEFSFER